MTGTPGRMGGVDARLRIGQPAGAGVAQVSRGVHDADQLTDEREVGFAFGDPLEGHQGEGHRERWQDKLASSHFDVSVGEIAWASSASEA